MEAKARPHTLINQANGRAGVRQTLKIMSELVSEYKKNQIIRETAVNLTAGLPQKDYVGEVRRIFDFVQNQIRYVRDVRGVETLQTPLVTLELKAGDCDDKSTLAAALLESVGHPTRFLAMGFLPGSYSHVTVQTRIGPKWIALETTEPVEMGWIPKNILNVMVRHNR